jgi:hypothetical protein
MTELSVNGYSLKGVTYCPNCGSINIFYDKTIGLMHCYICDLNAWLLEGSHQEPGDDDEE